MTEFSQPWDGEFVVVEEGEGAMTTAYEQMWRGRVPEAYDPVYWDWQPFPMYNFRRLLLMAVAVTGEGATFVDVGSGIGSKVIEAERAGLKAVGVERQAEYIAEARSNGADTWEGDIRDFPYYVLADIVYVNHPYRSRADEAEFERWVADQLRPGALLMIVNKEITPFGWTEIWNDPAEREGIWMKPADPAGEGSEG